MLNDNTKISVIIPVYNCESYFDRCSDTIINQSFSNLEILLIDDGSFDNSGKICDMIALRDSRVEVIHNFNLGVAYARNVGVKICCGDFVTFVDSDDYVETEFVEKMYSLILKYCADVAVVSAFFEEQGKSLDEEVNVRHSKWEISEYFFNSEVYKIRAPWGKLIKRKIVADNLFPENVRFGEDMATVYRWYDACKVSVDSNIKLYHYNLDNIGSLTHTLKKAELLDDLLVLNQIVDFLKINNHKSAYKRYCKAYVANADRCISILKNGSVKRKVKMMLRLFNKRNKTGCLSAKYRTKKWFKRKLRHCKERFSGK